MDGPGHYFRRIKSVAVTIPCVTGPYASVNCTLTLLKSSIRKTTQVGADYARDAGGEDDRFSDYFGSMQSITTSSAQNDTGMFETNLRDERYLPFEHSGVISQWQLELPANPGRIVAISSHEQGNAALLAAGAHAACPKASFARILERLAAAPGDAG